MEVLPRVPVLPLEAQRSAQHEYGEQGQEDERSWHAADSSRRALWRHCLIPVARPGDFAPGLGAGDGEAWGSHVQITGRAASSPNLWAGVGRFVARPSPCYDPVGRASRSAIADPRRQEPGALEDIGYDRLCRTAQSEAYLVSQGEETLARVDLHFTSSVVYGVIVVERDLEEDDVTSLIERIDEDLVWSADSPRDDFVVSVYQGREIGVYSDPTLDDEDDDVDGET
jgi:hypothetical protein